MTEPVMYFGIGFFVATLLGLLVVVRVHHRALHFGSVDQIHADVRQRPSFEFLGSPFWM